MTEECKKEIDEYTLYKEVREEGNTLFHDNSSTIWRPPIIDSKKGIDQKLLEKFIQPRKHSVIDRYFLEYIGHILRKHSITEVEVISERTYYSTTWKFDDIKQK